MCQLTVSELTICQGDLVVKNLTWWFVQITNLLLRFCPKKLVQKI